MRSSSRLLPMMLGMALAGMSNGGWSQPSPSQPKQTSKSKKKRRKKKQAQLVSPPSQSQIGNRKMRRKAKR